MTNWEKLFEEYKSRMSVLSNDDLVEAFNTQVGNGGWGTARSYYLSALRQEFVSRNIDFSIIGDKDQLSYINEVKLVGNKLELKTEK